MGRSASNRRRALGAITGFTLALVVASVPAPARGQTAAISIDSLFEDWTAVPVALVDPAGDSGPGEIDFGRVWLADDPRFFFVRVELGIDVDPSENNDLRLYLDTDADSGTGLPIAGLGAELEWRFGARNGTFHYLGQTTVYHDDIRFRQAPTVTADEFELAIGRDTMPDGSHPLFLGNEVRVALVDFAGSDRVPDTGETLGMLLDTGPPPATPQVPLARESAFDLRLATWNVLSDGPWDPALADSFGRQLAATVPDIVSFQEIYDHSPAQTADLVEAWVPLGPGESWHAAGNNDCKTVSRHPIVDSWALDGNLAVRIDTTETLGSELLLVNAHLPCCANDSGRQQEIDRIMAFVRDAKEPGGVVDLVPGTPIVITGDMNLVGFAQQLDTLLTGDIVNPQFGPDFDPDWDGTALANLVSRQTEKRMGYTWRSDSSSYWPGHLDFQIYSDSVLERRNHFLVYTPEMSDPWSEGMMPDDSKASDHLLFCADFRALSVEEPALRTDPPAGDSLEFGTVRVGSQTTRPILVSNEGDPGSVLFGEFGGANGPFDPDDALPFGPLGGGETDSRDYVYAPASRAAHFVDVTVTSNDSEAVITLAGSAVGPVIATSRPDGSTVRFGPRSPFGAVAPLRVANATPDDDGGDPSNTVLTLHAASIEGPDAARFALSGFAAGTVLEPGAGVDLGIRFLGRPLAAPATLRATLRISTDEGAPAGGIGTELRFELEAVDRRRDR
jgi:hypothetical protein